MAGASVSIDGTYYGATSGHDGYYSFSVADTGRFTLVITLLGYKRIEKPVVLGSKPVIVSAALQEETTELTAVTISAGVFEASDKKRNTVLKPLDIVTTAGQQADLVAALKTLPGAQQVGEQEGLFVRGGTGAETKIFIDGLMVPNPFFSGVPDIAQRGRFSPLLFKGTHFSSGGYSAQYGQGLSAVLTLETHDLPTRSETNMIISSPQLSVIRQQLNKARNASAGVTINYNNLKPYFSIVKQKLHYTHEPEVINGELFGRLQKKQGIWKYYGYGNYNSIAFNKPSIGGNGLKDFFQLTNRHLFTLLTYNGILKRNWRLQTGVAFTVNKDVINLFTKATDSMTGKFLPRINNYHSQARAVLTKNFTGLHKLNFGIEQQHLVDKIHAADSIPFITRIDHYTALFAESDIYISARLVARQGIRYEYSSLMVTGKLSPRLSFAYKIKTGGQFSLAYGIYYQKPETNYLFRNKDLDFAKATHYLFNYQQIKDGQTIRTEIFYKKYQQLVNFSPDQPSIIANEGNGYARGIELFWRDKKSLRHLDYWIAYSFLDTKRKFIDYPKKVHPSFAAKHTLNVVIKQFIEKIATNFSLTYTYASGRPYANPNLSPDQFMSERTTDYHNVGLQLNYLTMIGKVNAVLIFNANNILGSKQVFGYHFARDQNIEGLYPGQAITPMAKRFFFFGIYLSMGNDRRKQVIDN